MADSPDETSREYLDDMARELGRLVISFSQLEHAATMLIAEILELSQVAERALVRPMMIANKLALLRLLCKQHVKPKNREAVVGWIERVAKASERRNDLAHGLYVHKDRKAFILSFSGGHRLTGNPKRQSAKEIALLSLEVQDIRSEAQQLRDFFDIPRRTDD